MDDLDRRIKSWGAQYPSQGPGEPLLQRIVASLRGRAAPNVQVRLSSYRRQLIWTRAALAACSVLLVVAVVPEQPRVAQVPAPGPEARLALAPQELREMREVATAIDATFPEGVLWIRQAGGTRDVGTGRPAAIGGQTQRLLISFHVIRLAPDGTATVSRRDVIVQDGEPLSLGDGQRVALWTHQVDDQYISVELDDRFGDEQIAIQVRDRLLQAFGQPTLIAQAASQEHRYEVYQTVYRL